MSGRWSKAHWDRAPGNYWHRVLRRMKAVTHHEKDAGDLVILPQWFAAHCR
jgi:hypothetical protein